MIKNFCKYCILQGGELFPLNIPAENTNHTGVCNPSIFDDGDSVYISLRNVNYLLYQNLNKKFQTRSGETLYTTPENDLRLKTKNFICKYEIETNTISDYKLIDTSTFDKPPVWDFVGHEDVRLVRWNGKFYATGCRRDVKGNGESRMELSEIDLSTGKELNRVRIKAPGDNTSYCEKNWMPILDKPFHYIKWTNPTELVCVNPETGDCTSLFIKDTWADVKTTRALRGSSQIIPYKGNYICLVHEVDLYLNELDRKECKYYMKFVVFDKNFNIIKVSDEFNFLNFSIEFTNGLMHKNGYFYIPFAVMDTVSFMLKVSDTVVDDFINNSYNSEKSDSNIFIVQKDDIYRKICLENEKAESWNILGKELRKQNQYYQSAVSYARAIEEKQESIDKLYENLYFLADSFSCVGHRDATELSFWENCINADSSRSEAYIRLARYYTWRGNLTTAYMYSKIAYELNSYKNLDVSKLDAEFLYYKLMYYCGNKLEAELNLISLKNYVISSHNDDYGKFYINQIDVILNEIKRNKAKRKKVV